MKGWFNLILLIIALSINPHVFAADSALAYFHQQAAQGQLQQAEKFLQNQDYNKAATLYNKLANEKNSIAEYQLGYLSQHGFGIDKDDLIANSYFLKAAEQGLAQAKFALGTIYLANRSTEEALSWLKLAAQDNEPHALYMFGVMNEKGSNFPQNPVVAMTFYKKAGQLGVHQALYNLALMLMQQPAPKMADALANFTAAAKLGSAKAQDALGVFYSTGIYGVTIDQAKAFAYFTQAAQQNLIEGEYNLGVMYYNGWGTVPDQKNALQWVTKAADQGLPNAVYLEGYLAYNGIGEIKNVPQALALYEKAAELGLADAQLAAATLYHNGEGAVKDDIKAFSYFLAAAKQNQPFAQYMTGLSYAQGLGVIPDKAAALSWYEKAASLGVDKAQLAAAAVYTNGDGVAQSDQMAYVWLSLAITSSDPTIHETAAASREDLSKLMQPTELAAADALAATYYQRISNLAKSH